MIPERILFGGADGKEFISSHLPITANSLQLYQLLHVDIRYSRHNHYSTQISSTKIHLNSLFRSLLAKQVVFEDSVVQLLPRGVIVNEVWN